MSHWLQAPQHGLSASLQQNDTGLIKFSGDKLQDVDCMSEASTTSGSTGFGPTPFSSLGSQSVGGFDLQPVEEDFEFDLSDDVVTDANASKDNAADAPLCPPGLALGCPPGLVMCKQDEKEALKMENMRLQYENALLMQSTLQAAQRAQLATQYAMLAQYSTAMMPHMLGMSPSKTSVVKVGQQKPAKPLPSKGKLTDAKHAAKPTALRTTIVLRNIPKSFSRAQAVEFLEQHDFAGTFDFVYVPFDFKFNGSVGFAFVNFVSHDIAVKAFDVLAGFSWDTTKPGKECKVNWASPHQGLEAHIAHFRNSPVMHEDVKEEYKPAVFKAGRQVEFPKPTIELRPPRTRPGHVTGRRSQFADGSSA
jgi:hypothetical protein